ncbi:hypothetical protein H0H93_000411, partial [Arthromyces matolae]
MKAKLTVPVSILLLSALLVAASPLPLLGGSSSLNLQSLPKAKVNSSSGSLIVARMPDEDSPSEDDIAETYLAWLQGSQKPALKTLSDHDRLGWEIGDTRNEIYQG